MGLCTRYALARETPSRGRQGQRSHTGNIKYEKLNEEYRFVLFFFPGCTPVLFAEPEMMHRVGCRFELEFVLGSSTSPVLGSKCDLGFQS